MGQAQGAPDQYTLPAQPVAGFTPDQLAAQQGTRNVQGMAQPYYNQAYGMALQAASPLTGGTIEQYLNPYTDWVTKQMNNVFGKQMRDVTGGLTQAAGGVGADRIAVGQSDLANQQGLAAGQTYAGIYDNAIRAAQADAARGLQGAGTVSNLGTTAQNSALQGLQALFGSGGQQQQLTQGQLQALWNQLASQFSFGFQRPQYEAGITGALAPAAGGTSQGTQVTTAPPPSLLSQILGGVAGGVGMAGKAGLFNNSGGKGSDSGAPDYGYNVAAYPGSSPTFQNGMYVPTFPAYRGGRINRRADGGGLPMRDAYPARTSRPPRVYTEPADSSYRVNEAVDRINEAHSGGSPVQEYQPLMAAGGPAGGAIGTNPFDTSDVGQFDSPLQTNARPLIDRFQKIGFGSPQGAQQQNNDGAAIGAAMKTAMQFLPMLMANRGGAVEMPHIGYEDGGDVSFDERYPSPTAAFDASGNPQGRGPVFPAISNVERLRNALINRAAPAAASRQLFRMLQGFDSGGNVEPLRMSEAKMADALQRLKNAGILNPSAAKDFAAARYKRMGINPEEVVGQPAKYAFGGTAGQQFGDFTPYDSTQFDPSLSPYGGDIVLPKKNNLGLGIEPNWSPAQQRAPARAAAGLPTNVDDDGDVEIPAKAALRGPADPTTGPYSRYERPGGILRPPPEFTPYPDATSTREYGSKFSPWDALARAGFAIMGGTSPYAGVNIGKGALEGLKAFEENRADKMKQEEINLRAQGIWNQMQQHEDQYKYMTPAQIAAANEADKRTAILADKEQREQQKDLRELYQSPNYTPDGGFMLIPKEPGKSPVLKFDPDGKLVTVGGNPPTDEDQRKYGHFAQGATQPVTPPPATPKKEEPPDSTSSVSPLGGKVVTAPPNEMTAPTTTGAERDPAMINSYNNPRSQQEGKKASIAAAKELDKQLVPAKKLEMSAIKIQRDLETVKNWRDSLDPKAKSTPFIQTLFNPGSNWATRAKAIQEYNTWAANTRLPQIPPEVIAAITESDKEQLMGGFRNIIGEGMSAREAQPIIQAAVAAMPGMATPESASMLIASAMREASQSVKDRISFFNEYRRNNYGFTDGWSDKFEKNNNASRYVARTLERTFTPEQKQNLPKYVEALRKDRDAVIAAEKSGDQAAISNARNNYLQRKGLFNREFGNLADFYMFGTL